MTRDEGFRRLAMALDATHVPGYYAGALQGARSERMGLAAGRLYQVFSLKKDGSPSARPFNNDYFTEEEAQKKIQYWEGLNPGTKFVIKKTRSA